MNSYGICDDEWILRKTEGTYFLRVGDFASKVYWPVGTFLDSKVFLIGNTKFKLRFFPNCVYPSKKVLSNDGENNEIENFEENFVGVYIYNESNFDVLADIKLTLGPRTMALQKQFLRERECVGWPQFFTHRELHGGVLNREGKLEVRAEVTTNWERRVDHVQSLTSADLLQGILAELNTLRQEMAGLQAWAKMTHHEDHQGPEARWPRCAKCEESLQPPAVLYQCHAGHVTCGGCAGNVEADVCSLCKESFSGRASGLEAYLRNLSSSHK